MSAFTPITDAMVADVLAPFGLQAESWQVATEGIENSNFFIHARDRHGNAHAQVLTLFEYFGSAAIPWFIELLDRLAALDLPVPQPLRAGGGALLEVAGKPAVLVPRLPGRHVRAPTPEHCVAIGAALARVHQCQITPPEHHHGPAEQLLALTPLVQRLPPTDRGDARAVLQRWSMRRGERVLCHGDLFRDNALFQGSRLSGLLDFYNAGHELAIWDLAVAANDWCLHGDGGPDPVREHALLQGYQQVRTLSRHDLAGLPLATTVAALRFWLSRLQAPPSGAEGRGGKDPEEFARIYRARRAFMAASR